MNRVLALLLSISIAIALLAGCGKTDDKDSQFLSTHTSDEDKIEPPNPSKETVETDSKIEEFTALLRPLANAGLLLSNWGRLEDMESNTLLQYYLYSIEADNNENTNTLNDELIIPAEEVEAFLSNKFYGDSKLLRQSSFYQDETESYVIQNNPKNQTDLTVTNVITVFNTHVMLQQVPAEDKTQDAVIAIVIVDQDFGNRFVSCHVVSDQHTNQFIIGQELGNDAIKSFMKSADNDIFTQLLNFAGTITYDSAPIEGFGSPEEISSDTLLKFYANIFARNNDRLRESFDNTDGNYHVSLNNIKGFLNQYFDHYNFVSGEITLAGFTYLEDSDEILLPPDIVYNPKSEIYEIVSKEIVSEDTALITALRLENTEEGINPISRDVLKIRITSTGFKLISFLCEPLEKS